MASPNQRRLGIAEAAHLIQHRIPFSTPILGPMAAGSRLATDAVGLAANAAATAQKAEQIHQEGLAKHHGHNDAGDAMRHAETSRRISEALSPEAAFVLGALNELKGLFLWGEPQDERIMDFHNNREGRTAFREGRPVNPTNLQVQPGPSPTPKKDYPYR